LPMPFKRASTVMKIKNAFEYNDCNVLRY